MDYAELLRHFRCPSIKARFVRADVRFVRSVFSGRLDCNHLVSKFALLVPGRRSRHTGVFHVPFGRVDTVKRSYWFVSQSWWMTFYLERHARIFSSLPGTSGQIWLITPKVWAHIWHSMEKANHYSSSCCFLLFTCTYLAPFLAFVTFIHYLWTFVALSFMAFAPFSAHAYIPMCLYARMWVCGGGGDVCACMSVGLGR